MTKTLSSLGLAMLIALPALAAVPDYNRDIRPILSENCFACHGFDEKHREADLRLDVGEEAIKERDGVFAIKPGDVDKSEVWYRLITDDEDDLMPPPDSHLKLTATEKEKIKAWIEGGAPYAGHWSFIPPTRPQVDAKAGHPIDVMVRKRLVEEGMKPSPEADRAMLIRRVSLDLTGLPPTAEEVEAFVKDDRPQAYEGLVDRLMKSPHFGERLALDWLDAARYADTNGFSIDGGRHLWLWRDWVIQAFNDNKPYDRFLIEQLAGDLLPNAGEAELIATGFQRNNMVTHEGGTIPAENLTNYNVDRVKTLGESVLGLTLGCAQCHDHKFDPITQKDYYQMFAFFNSLDDAGLDGNRGINPNPSIQAKTVLKTPEVPQLKKQIERLEKVLATPNERILSAWEKREQGELAKRGKGLALHPVEVLGISSPNRSAEYEPVDGNGVLFQNVRGSGAFDVVTKLPELEVPVTGLRVVVEADAELPGGGWGYGPSTRVPGPKDPKTGRAAMVDSVPEKGTFVLTAIAGTADEIPGDQVNLHRLIAISRATASSWLPEAPPKDALHPLNETGWQPANDAKGPVHFTVTFEEPLDTRATPYFTVQLNFGRGDNLIPKKLRLEVLTGIDDGSDLTPETIAVLGTPAAQRNAEQQAALWSVCAAESPALERTRVALANARDRLSSLTEPHPTMVMNVSAKPRDTFILNRGDYSQPTVKVSTGTPAALPPIPDEARPDRLGLARWLTMPNHPLTARVAVNRFWKLLFGQGIVTTPADFGMQGAWPSHPDVLDWLAVEFVESGWDVKHVLKQIVMSQTYRQTSAATKEGLERDPNNQLLARGPRFRLPAELVRDSALKISGLLVPRIGGPSVNPYMPGDLWREVSHYGSSPATAQTFIQDHGEKLYRRSLYTYWKRTAPPPNMTAFDAPNREVCTIERGSTTTPLQALVTLNDPQFVEAARAFAERMLHREGSDAERLRWAFEEAVSRAPSDADVAVLKKALSRERAHYGDNAADAAELLAVGESPRDAKLPAGEHAAWTQVASLLLNLSEVVTRN